MCAGIHSFSVVVWLKTWSLDALLFCPEHIIVCNFPSRFRSLIMSLTPPVPLQPSVPFAGDDSVLTTPFRASHSQGVRTQTVHDLRHGSDEQVQGIINQVVDRSLNPLWHSSQATSSGKFNVITGSPSQQQREQSRGRRARVLGGEEMPRSTMFGGRMLTTETM